MKIIEETSIAPMQVEILRLRKIRTTKDIVRIYKKFGEVHAFAKEVLSWCGIGIKTLVKMLTMMGMELPKKEDQ